MRRVRVEQRRTTGYLRVTAGGLLRVDAAKVKTEQRLDGKYCCAAPPAGQILFAPAGYPAIWRPWAEA